jgi:hypothetical protein
MDAVESDRSPATYRTNFVPPVYQSKSKPPKEPKRKRRQAFCFLLISWYEARGNAFLRNVGGLLWDYAVTSIVTAVRTSDPT